MGEARGSEDVLGTEDQRGGRVLWPVPVAGIRHALVAPVVAVPGEVCKRGQQNMQSFLKGCGCLLGTTQFPAQNGIVY